MARTAEFGAGRTSKSEILEAEIPSLSAPPRRPPPRLLPPPPLAAHARAVPSSPRFSPMTSVRSRAKKTLYLSLFSLHAPKKVTATARVIQPRRNKGRRALKKRLLLSLPRRARHSLLLTPRAWIHRTYIYIGFPLPAKSLNETIFFSYEGGEGGRKREGSFRDRGSIFRKRSRVTSRGFEDGSRRRRRTWKTRNGATRVGGGWMAAVGQGKRSRAVFQRNNKETAVCLLYYIALREPA